MKLLSKREMRERREEVGELPLLLRSASPPYPINTAKKMLLTCFSRASRSPKVMMYLVRGLGWKGRGRWRVGGS